MDKKSQDEISTEVAVRMQQRLTRSTFPTYYAVTANGFITNDLWIEVIAQLKKILIPSMGGKSALLLLDRHSTHLELSSMKSMIDSYMHPLYLPAHTTHILQPLDDIIFSNLKGRLLAKKDLEVMRRILTGQPIETVIQDLVEGLDTDWFDSKIIKAGFANAGIYPYDKS